MKKLIKKIKRKFIKEIKLSFKYFINNSIMLIY